MASSQSFRLDTDNTVYGFPTACVFNPVLIFGFSSFPFADRTILLSVISLFNEPNTSSPANVDASVMYRRWKDSKGKDAEYANIIKKQVSIQLLSIC